MSQNLHRFGICNPFSLVLSTGDIISARSRAGTEQPMRTQRERRRSRRRRLLGSRGVIAEPDRPGGGAGPGGQREAAAGLGAGCAAPRLGTAGDSLNTALRRCRGNRKS